MSWSKLNPEIVASLVLTDGSWPSYTSVGSYPLFYVCNHDSVLCANCAQKAWEDPDTYEKEKPTDVAIHYEGAAMDCESCGELIESAYGEPEPTTVQEWVHQNVEGSESDEIEVTWTKHSEDQFIAELYVNDELVKTSEPRYGVGPAEHAVRLSQAIDMANHWYAYNE